MTRRTLVAVVGNMCVALFVAVLVGAAAVAIVRGLRTAFAEAWGGRVWLGDLSAGLVAIALAAATFALAAWNFERREFKRLRNKYSESSHEDVTDDSAETTADAR